MTFRRVAESYAPFRGYWTSRHVPHGLRRGLLSFALPGLARRGQAAPPAPPLPAQDLSWWRRRRRLRSAMMLPALFSVALWGQANLTTTWVNGLQMAAVLHGSTGLAVTNDSPAEPGETLVLQGSGFSGGAQILVAGAAVDTTVIDDGVAAADRRTGSGAH